MSAHKDEAGSIVREPKRASKAFWCYECRNGKHFGCTKMRRTVGREKKPCECKCELHLLDPNL